MRRCCYLSPFASCVRVNANEGLAVSETALNRLPVSDGRDRPQPVPRRTLTSRRGATSRRIGGYLHAA
jgi:hypothetical protein